MTPSNLTFSAVWASAVKRFGESFWPLIGIAALGGAVLIVIVLLGVGSFVAKSFIITGETVTPAETISVYSIVMLVLSVLAAMAVSVWTQVALILRTHRPAALNHTIMTAIKSWWPVILTGLLVILVAGGPVLIGVGLMIFGLVVNTTLAFSAGILVAAAVIWSIVFGVWATFSSYLVVLENLSPIQAIKTSMQLVRPVALKVFGYLFLLGLIVGVATAVIGMIPVVGSFAVQLVSTPATIVFQYAMFRMIRDAGQPTAPVTAVNPPA